MSILSYFKPEEGRESEFKLIAASLLIPYFVSFYSLVTSLNTSVSFGAFPGCWSYLPNCDAWYFLQALPFGYSQTMFYAGVFLVFLLLIEGILKERWVRVWWLFLFLFSWKIFTSFVIGSQPGNFEYYDVVLTIAFLFLPYRSWFIRLAFVTLYFAASTIKIHEGWILGTYFTSLETGLAVFGDGYAPVVTMSVIFAQMVASWFLLSSDEHKRNLAFIYFLSFHLFSIVYVGWRYPSSDLFMLGTLFYLYKNPAPVPFNRSSAVGYAFIALLICIQIIPKALIPGDNRFTLEANTIGLYMFEANHQCLSELTKVIKGEGGTVEPIASTTVSFSMNAGSRCNPVFYLQRIQRACPADSSFTYAWTFDHSINGGPFYRMIDENDACALTYQTFKKNDWIRYREAEMEIIGYPLKNYYY